MPAKTFQITNTVWLYPGEAAWHFVSIPTETSEEIDFYFSSLKRGWGSLPVRVSLGQSNWKTSIFPDKKSNCYLLPLKAEVRSKENILVGDTIEFSIEVLE